MKPGAARGLDRDVGRDRVRVLFHIPRRPHLMTVVVEKICRGPDLDHGHGLIRALAHAPTMLPPASATMKHIDLYLYRSRNHALTRSDDGESEGVRAGVCQEGSTANGEESTTRRVELREATPSLGRPLRAVHRDAPMERFVSDIFYVLAVQSTPFQKRRMQPPSPCSIRACAMSSYGRS